MTFAGILVEQRTRRCLSQQELAEAAGVSVRTISNLERATARPQRGTVRALADGLGLAGDERLTFERTARPAVPALVSGTAPEPGHLPAPVSSIIGRDRETELLARLVRHAPARMVTITGPGGVGKSRLALEVAWRVAPRLHRADAVDLSSLRDGDELCGAIAAAVGAATRPGSALTVVAAHLGELPWLLVLDSVEHIPEAGAILGELRLRCPRLRLLATSRSPVRLPGERVWPLAPLAVPDLTTDPVAVAGYSAVALLIERTRAVRPGFRVTADNAGAVVAMCRRLDGLPLAIELAARRLRAEEPATLAAQLTAGSTDLRSDLIDIPGRHRTLRATVEWTTGRLTAEERWVLSVLGAFRGTASRDAVDAVLAGSGAPAVPLDAALSRLADVSLVRLVGEPGRLRVEMLDTIRETAAELLAGSGREPVCRAAHAGYLRALLRDAAADSGFDPLDADLDDIRAALAYTIETEPASFDAGLVTAVADFHAAHGRFTEAHRVLTAIARASRDTTTAGRALLRAGVAANEHGDHLAALTLGGLADGRFRESGEETGRCASLNLIGAAHKALGQLRAARQAYQQCLDLAEAAGERRYATVALNNLGTVAHDQGCYAVARRYYAQSLQVKRELADRLGIAVGLVNLGTLYQDLGDHAEADRYLTDAVRRFRAEGDRPHSLAFALAWHAQAQLGLGDDHTADRTAREAERISQRIGHTQTQAMARMSLGDLARTRRQVRLAERHYRTALSEVTEPFERARILERLAATRLDRDGDEARRLLAEAEEIRGSRRYRMPPVDRDLAHATRARLSQVDAAGDDEPEVVRPVG